MFRETSAERVAEYERWLGRPVQHVVDFSARDTWQHIADPGYMLDEWRGCGWRPVYSVAMLPDDPTATMQAGAAGAYDTHFMELGRRLVAAGQAGAVLRIGWEFNLAESRWSTPDPRQFIAYWRRIAAALDSVPGQRFELDWTVNNGPSPFDASLYYPGEDVVDYVGVDVYDVSGEAYPYPPACDRGCRESAQARAWEGTIWGGERGLRFWRDFAAARGKPLSLPEWGLWQRPDGTGGGDNPLFLRNMHSFITDETNNVAYAAYFEHDGADGQHRLMTTFAEAGRLYRDLVRS